jgi:hypothetical protein
VTAAEVLALVERTFPLVDRPAAEDLPYHPGDCAHCYFTTRELLEHPGPALPPEAVRSLHNDLSSLSAAATAWVLPSYLRHVLTTEDPRDPLPTEYLIYTLGPSPEHAAETAERLARLTAEQVGTLLALLEHLRGNGWADSHADDLDRAAAFLRGLPKDVRARAGEP